MEEPKTQKVIKGPVASRRVMSGAMCCGTSGRPEEPLVASIEQSP